MSSRPAVNVQFDHTAIAVPRNEQPRDFILDLFGGRVLWNNWPDTDPPTFLGVQTLYDGTMLEFVAPAHPQSFVQTFLEKRGPGLHHITWKIENMEDLIGWLEEERIPLTGVERRKGIIANAFIRPSASFGVLIQFRPAEKWNDDIERTDHPAKVNVPPPRPSRGRIDATAIVADDGQSAVGFYHSVLGGQLEHVRREQGSWAQALRTGDTRLDFYWPDEHDGMAARHLAQSGPGLHHLAFKLSAYDETLTAAKSLDVQTEPVPGMKDEVYILPNNPTGTRFRLSRA
jgi:catechol 2,3-dioxygenase-like lactoylglutathione lyase family enzyme